MQLKSSQMGCLGPGLKETQSSAPSPSGVRAYCTMGTFMRSSTEPQYPEFSLVFHYTDMVDQIVGHMIELSLQSPNPSSLQSQVDPKFQYSTHMVGLSDVHPPLLKLSKGPLESPH